MIRVPLQRKTRLRPVSQKRRKQQPARARCIAAVRKRSGGWCEAHLFGCDGKGCHAHEKLMRSQGGSTTDECNVLWLCAKCHAWVHANPKEAVQRGLLIRRSG